MPGTLLNTSLYILTHITFKLIVILTCKLKHGTGLSNFLKTTQHLSGRGRIQTQSMLSNYKSCHFWVSKTMWIFYLFLSSKSTVGFDDYFILRMRKLRVRECKWIKLGCEGVKFMRSTTRPNVPWQSQPTQGRASQGAVQGLRPFTGWATSRLLHNDAKMVFALCTLTFSWELCFTRGYMTWILWQTGSRIKYKNTANFF